MKKSLFPTLLIGSFCWTTATYAVAPLISQSDLAYLGAFRVPSGQFGSSPNASFAYSDDGLAYNAIDNSLFIKGHTSGQLVAEINIPTPVNSSNIASLNTATVRQNFADITERNLNQQSIGNGMILGGLLVYGGKLVGAEWAYYDAAGQQTKSHFTSGLNLAATGDFGGLYTVGSAAPAFVGGYMAPIPSEWQSALGGSALTGHCCTSIISHQSLGPSAWVFDPAKLSVQDPVPATPVVYYDLAHPTLGNWSHPLPANPIYNIRTLITGVIFPPGTRSILFFGSTGIGEQCYGQGMSSGTNVDGVSCYDPPYAGWKGNHAYPYRYYVWAYDVNDFISVKNSMKNPWDIRPYSTWELTLPFGDGRIELNGAAYDPTSGRIYLAQKYGDNSQAYGLPVIHVFQLTTSTNTQTLSPPANLRVTVP